MPADVLATASRADQIAGPRPAASELNDRLTNLNAAAVLVQVRPAQAAQLSPTQTAVRCQLVEHRQPVMRHVLKEARGVLRFPDTQLLAGLVVRDRVQAPFGRVGADELAPSGRSQSSPKRAPVALKGRRLPLRHVAAGVTRSAAEGLWLAQLTKRTLHMTTPQIAEQDMPQRRPPEVDDMSPVERQRLWRAPPLSELLEPRVSDARAQLGSENAVERGQACSTGKTGVTRGHADDIESTPFAESLRQGLVKVSNEVLASAVQRRSCGGFPR